MSASRSMRWFLYCNLSLWAITALANPGKGFNPDTSINFLGLLQQGNQLSGSRGADSHNGVVLQEAELQFFSDVDPYLKANALFSVSPKSGSPGEYGLDPEEVTVETTFIPSMTLKAGKFKAALGRHNSLHTHAFPFVDAPLVNQAIFGREGLNEAGVSAAWMIPMDWYSELTVQAMSNGNSFFNSSQAGDFLEVIQLRNLWELSGQTTLEWSLYGTQGPNPYDLRSTAYGSDLVVKWRPAEGGKYKGLAWVTQYLRGNRNGETEQTTGPVYAKLAGIATWLQYQFAERWWIQGRYEYLGFPDGSIFQSASKQSVLLGFFPSEFSGFRLQLDHGGQAGTPDAYAAALQFNVTIGAHPAHSY